MLKQIELPRNRHIDIYYTDDVYDPGFSAIDTIVVADKFLAPAQRVLDVGCGSGIIALSLKRLNPWADVHAVDIDREARRITEYNAKKLKLKISVMSGDLAEGRTGFDMIVANLPTFDDEDMEQHVLHGPDVAYFADKKDGLKLYKRLIKQAETALNSEGILVFECQSKLQDKLEKYAHSKDWVTMMKTDACLAFVRKELLAPEY